jgi:hypothetical protein
MAGRIAGLLFRDTESFKGLPDSGMIVDGEDKFAFKPLRIPLSFPKSSIEKMPSPLY